MTVCPVCGGEVTKLMVGKSPVAGYTCKSKEESILQPLIEMNLQVCKFCSMTQYEWFEDATEVLDKLYSGHFATYHFTEAMSQYMNWFVDLLSEKYQLDKKSNILEIGCNSGRMLSMFKNKLECAVVGVEPSTTFESEWQRYDLEVINGYFGAPIARELASQNFDLIYFRHVYEHIPSPVSFFGDVASLAGRDTAIVVEVPYLKNVIKNRRIENISYSHLNYYTIKSMAKIAEKFNFGIAEFDLVNTDGGSIIFYLRNGIETDPRMLDDVTALDLDNLLEYLSKAKEAVVSQISQYSKDEVIGYGAGAKGQHLIHMLDLEDSLSFVVDDTPELVGRYIPGTSIPIKSPSDIDLDTVKCVVNLVPTHAEAIKSKVNERFHFIDPVND